MYITDVKKIQPFKKRLLHFDYLNTAAITAEIDIVSNLLKMTISDSEKNQYKKTIRYLSKLHKKQPIRAQAIIKKEDKILFLKCFGKRHLDIFYCLPGGALSEGESSHTALDREIYEELGASLHIIHQYPSIYDYSDHDFYLRYDSFLCELDGILAKNHKAIEENTEILELVWIDIESLIEKSLDDDMFFHTVPSMQEIYTLLKP